MNGLGLPQDQCLCFPPWLACLCSSTLNYLHGSHRQAQRKERNELQTFPASLRSTSGSRGWSSFSVTHGCHKSGTLHGDWELRGPALKELIWITFLLRPLSCWFLRAKEKRLESRGGGDGEQRFFLLFIYWTNMYWATMCRAFYQNWFCTPLHWGRTIRFREESEKQF